MMTGKKAQGPTGLVIAMTIITLALIVVYFVSTLQSSGAERKINGAENRIDEQTTLLNYLKTPVDSEQTITDIITKYKYTNDNNLKELLKTRTAQVLDPLFAGTKNFWRIKLDGQTLIEKKSCGELRKSEQEIMLYDGKRAKVELVVCD
jgi:hypothetical protein